MGNIFFQSQENWNKRIEKNLIQLHENWKDWDNYKC
jgi:hypothetical protein